MNEAELDRIIGSNPGVDRKLLEESTKMVEELRRLGWKPEGYSLALPGAVAVTPKQSFELSLDASPVSRSPVVGGGARNSRHRP